MFQFTNWYAPSGNLIRWGISTVILAFIFLGIYKFIPCVHISFREALPGTIFRHSVGRQAHSLFQPMSVLITIR